jgi:hypothetical protein
MALLMEAGSALSSPKWRGDLRWTSSSSEESLDMVIRHNGLGFDLIYATMKQRQNKLEVMARQNLPAEVFEALGVPNTGILEGPLIYHLVRILSKYKITIPDELKLPDQQGTVYHAIAAGLYYNTTEYRMVLQKFFDAGFCCIDESNCRGLSPLASIYPRCIQYLSFALWYAGWLLSKGASLITLMKSSEVASTAAHHLAFNIGASIVNYTYSKRSQKNGIGDSSRTNLSFWGYMKDLDSNSERFLYDLCLKSLCDECRCTCSSSGCTPFIALLKGIRYSYHIFYPEHAQSESEQKQVWLLEWIESIRRSLSVSSTDFNWLEFTDQVIHFATHQRLGLSHLCCEREPRNIFRHRHELGDLQRIRDDEALLIIKHKDLIAEFMDEYKRQNTLLSTFMNGFWRERMDQVLLDEDFATNKVLDELRRLGVDV